MADVFLDTAYAVALSAESDDLHVKAVHLAEKIEAEGMRMVVTRAVMVEIGNALSKLRYRAVAVELLQSLEDDPNVEIIPCSEELYTRAFRLFSERPDKEWGMTDCISFVVMQERGIVEALTADSHFRQGGFRPLLQDD